jgi:hypothetical protein
METRRAPCPQVPGRRKAWTSQTAQQAVLLTVDRYGPGILRWSAWSKAGLAPSVPTLPAIIRLVGRHSRIHQRP